MKHVALLSAIVLLFAWNAPAYSGGCGMGTVMSPHVASALNLTDDQKVRIEARRKAFVEETSPLRDKLFSKKVELRDLWTKANPDQTAIARKQSEIRAIQDEIQEKTTRFQLDCRQCLTPDQQQKLRTLVVDRGGWGGAGPGGGQGWQMRGR